MRKVYIIVNLNYLALSREMEFHADEVAANVAGPKPMISSLLRLGLADQSFNSVLEYYGRQVDKCVKTDNIYAQHAWLMNFTAAENNMPMEGKLPQVGREDMSRFNKSKLSIKDQWASHPSNDERIANLNRLGLPDKENDSTLASTLFADKDAIQEIFTEQIFKPVNYQNIPAIKTTEHFIDDYKLSYHQGSFHKVYNGYYDNKDIALTPVSEFTSKPDLTLKDLFSDAAVELIYVANSMEYDINTVKAISDGETAVKTFDYDGQRYTKREAATLLNQLTAALSELKIRIDKHDSYIFNYFLQQARKAGMEIDYKERYSAYGEAREAYEQRLNLYNKVMENTQFVQHTTPFETIETNFAELVPLENSLKAELTKILNHEKEQAELTEEISTSFENYLNNRNAYFAPPEYNQEALDKLFSAIANFFTASGNILFNTKKSMLEYQAGLLPAVNKVELLSA